MKTGDRVWYRAWPTSWMPGEIIGVQLGNGDLYDVRLDDGRHRLATREDLRSPEEQARASLLC